MTTAICRCGHPVIFHSLTNGGYHTDKSEQTNVCGCVFSRDEALRNQRASDNPVHIKHKYLKKAGWFVGGEYPYRDPHRGGMYSLDTAWDIFIGR